jgi:hypothetical protein
VEQVICFLHFKIFFSTLTKCLNRKKVSIINTRPGSQNNIVFTIDSTCNIKQQNIYNYQQKLEQNIHNKNLLKPILSQMNGKIVLFTHSSYICTLSPTILPTTCQNNKITFSTWRICKSYKIEFNRYFKYKTRQLLRCFWF